MVRWDRVGGGFRRQLGGEEEMEEVGWVDWWKSKVLLWFFKVDGRKKDFARAIFLCFW